MGTAHHSHAGEERCYTFGSIPLTRGDYACPLRFRNALPHPLGPALLGLCLDVLADARRAPGFASTDAITTE